jgi:hypothetical protein
MNDLERLWKSHPVEPEKNRAVLLACIQACTACAELCSACNDACIAEEDPASMRSCIRATADCADICLATLRILLRLSATHAELLRSQLRTCQTASEICAAECDRHEATHAHCKLCEEACKRCAQACWELASC